MAELTLPDNYNLETALLDLVPGVIRAKQLEFNTTRMTQLKDAIKMLALKSKRHNGWNHESITGQEINHLKELLWLYAKIGLQLNTSIKDSPVTAEGTLKMIISPTIHFPLEVRQVAFAIKSNLEAGNWGVPILAAPPETSLQITDSRRGSRVDSSSPGTLPEGYYTPAPANHPIFGVNGIMHGIEHSRGGQTKAYRIARGYAIKNAKVFGHNGLKVGDCFANQMAALRDGAHGMRIGGICGDVDLGVYSVTVSGMYDHLDKDTGDDLYYVVAGADTTTDQIVDMSKNTTKQLLRSAETQTSIRVIRTSKARWVHAPKAGMRYDGLYKITGYSEERNDRGGKFLRFKLRREVDQDPIVIGNPTPALARQFDAVKLGY